MGRSGPPSNTWFPGPTQVLNPNGSSIGAAVLAGLTSVTDHATRSVTISRIYVHSTAMRPNNTVFQCCFSTYADYDLIRCANEEVYLPLRQYNNETGYGRPM